MVEVFMLPVEEGDFLWIRYGDSKKSHILIDGGTADFGYLYKDILTYIYNRDELVEAVILTHIDNDHIQGAVDGLANTSEKVVQKIIKRIYFNTCNAIQRQQKIGGLDCAEKEIFASIWQETYGVGEAIAFLDVLEKKKISKRLLDFVIAGQIYNLGDGARLEIISPNEKELKKLAIKWEKYVKKKNDVLYGTGTEDHYEKDLEDLKTVRMGNDSSVNNRSSIAFLFTYQNVKMLFLGDASPKVCVDGTKNAGIKLPCNIDLMKLSHHGSKSNTSNTLLKAFPTRHYLVSTDGSGKKVPNKAVIAHLIATASEQKEPIWLLTNYEWWEDAYHGKFFSEKDKEMYLDTGKLKICLLDEDGLKIKDGVKVYGQCIEVE